MSDAYNVKATEINFPTYLKLSSVYYTYFLFSAYTLIIRFDIFHELSLHLIALFAVSYTGRKQPVI